MQTSSGQMHRVAAAVRARRMFTDEAVLDRLVTDSRMENVWREAANLTEERLVWFVDQVLINYDYAAYLREIREYNRWEVESLAGGVAAAKSLARMLEPSNRGLGRRFDPRPLHKRVPDATIVLEEISVALNEQLLVLKKEADEWPTSRKAASLGRQEFMRQLSATTRRTFGKPRHGMVATITNVVFDTRVKDTVDADAVKKACKRSRVRWRTPTEKGDNSGQK